MKKTDANFLKVFIMANLARKKTISYSKILLKLVKFILSKKKKILFHLILFLKKKLDALVWFSDKKRIMIVKKSSHDSIKRFYKQQKPK